MSTKERLAQVLREHGLGAMAILADEGHYDSFESKLKYPITALVNNLRRHGKDELAGRAWNGEFDGTPEEAEAWLEREGRKLLQERNHG
jgi:hypothetical protein